MRQMCAKYALRPASFNPSIGPGTCIGEGRTTFDEFIAQLVDNGNAPKWRFSRDRFGLGAGGSLSIVNEGGEFHTFTEVAAFGGGCISVLNDILGLTPVPECQPEVAPGVPAAFVTTGVAPGATRELDGLSPGMHRFQCLIHPWMHSTAVVRDD